MRRGRSRVCYQRNERRMMFGYINYLLDETSKPTPTQKYKQINSGMTILLSIIK